MKNAKPLIIPRKTAKQQRSKAMVEAILEGAARVLVRMGYDKASTNKIAETAGVSIGSLYQYFPTKESIVAALIEKHILLETEQMQKKIQDLENEKAEIILQRFVQFVMGLWGKNKTLRRVFIEQVPQIGKSKSVYQYEDKIGSQLYLVLLNSLNQKIPQDFELRSFIVTKSIMGVIRSATLQHPGYLDQEDVSNQISKMILSYIKN